MRWRRRRFAKRRRQARVEAAWYESVSKVAHGLWLMFGYHEEDCTCEVHASPKESNGQG